MLAVIILDPIPNNIKN